MPNATSNPAQWIEQGEATDTPALVSHSEADRDHKNVVTLVSASYSDGGSGTLTIRDNGVVAFTGSVHGSRDLRLDYRASHVVEVELAAGATGATGHVAMAGYPETVYH